MYVASTKYVTRKKQQQSGFIGKKDAHSMQIPRQRRTLSRKHPTLLYFLVSKIQRRDIQLQKSLKSPKNALATT